MMIKTNNNKSIEGILIFVSNCKIVSTTSNSFDGLQCFNGSLCKEMILIKFDQWQIIGKHIMGSYTTLCFLLLFIRWQLSLSASCLNKHQSHFYVKATTPFFLGSSNQGTFQRSLTFFNTLNTNRCPLADVKAAAAQD